MSDAFNYWAYELTLQQKRALARQAGITSWATRSEEELTKLLVENKKAKEIYEDAPVG